MKNLLSLFFMGTLAIFPNLKANPSCNFYEIEEAIILDEAQAVSHFTQTCPQVFGMTNASGQNLLHIAAEYDSPHVTETLIQSGFSPKVRDSYKRTPLFYAHSTRVAKTLLHAGTSPLTKDRYGQTPFTEALDRNNYQVMELLLDHGAKVLKIDLKLAAEDYDVEALDFLADHAVTKDIKNTGRYFKTFFFYEPSYRKVAQKLVQKGADLNLAKTISSRRSLLDFYVDEYIKETNNFQKMGTIAIEFLVKNGADVNGYMPRLGNSIFHGLFWKDDLKTSTRLIELFLNHGLNINHAYAKDSRKSALMKLPFHRHSSEFLKKMTQFLLEKGANPKQQSEDGRTPLHWAIRYANVDVAKTLIPVSNLGLRDKEGRTAEEYARARLKKTPMLWERKALAKIIKELRR